MSAAEARHQVAVIGDYMLDVYVTGAMNRVCPDAPAPVLDAESELMAAGGAGNVAAGCASHGLEVVAWGVTGRDDAARSLETLLAEAGVRLDALVGLEGRATLVKRRYCVDQRVVFRADEGTTAPAHAGIEVRLRAALSDLRAIVVSDYGYGTMTDAVLRVLQERGERKGVAGKPLLLVDAKEPARYRAAAPDVAKPNYRQLMALLGESAEPDRLAHVVRLRDRALEACGAGAVAVTLDEDGCVLLQHDVEPLHVPVPSADVRATSGAGDTFLVALASALLAGSTTADAVRSATHAASHACGTNGTVGAHRSRPVPPRDRGKRVDPASLATWAERVRAQGRRIALTNGCFDIFHAGHAEFLHAAAEAGDVLLVAVNTDTSVRRLKGDSRPVNGLEDRLRVLEAIGVVDAVTWFDDPTAAGVVAEVVPDAYVKGSDYRGLAFPEATFVRKHGGSVIFVDLLEGRSTSGIVERVRAKSLVAL